MVKPISPIRTAWEATLCTIHHYLAQVENRMRRIIIKHQAKHIERIVMSNVRVLKRAMARQAVADFVAKHPPTEPLELWADRLLEVVETATFATSTKRPKTLMEVFAEEEFLRYSPGLGGWR
jgi:hypothetical protein